MQVESNRGIKLSGFFRGKVVKHSLSGYGKCKVYIPGIYDSSFESSEFCDNLPDAEQASPLFGGVKNGNGMFSYPNIGSIVWCFFENEDQNRPVYFASTLGGPQSAGQFSQVNVFKDKDDGAYVHKIVCGKATILLSETGNIKIETRTINSQNKQKFNSVMIDQDGNIQIAANTSIDITTDYMDIKANKMLTIKSPVIEIKTNYESKNKDQNMFVLNSDSMMLNCEDGHLTTITMDNGANNL